MMEERNGLPELPKGWVWTAVGEITQPIEKVQPRKNPDTQFIYLDISSIDNRLNRVVEPKTYYGSEAPSRARQLIRVNDVLFSTVRTYLKNIALVPEIHDGQIASTGFSVLRGESGISSKYLFYYSLTDPFLNALSKLQRGTSYPAVRDSDVRAQPIPLPPLPEQQRIVAKIEELFTQLDAGVAALKKAKAQLRRYRQAVLKAAVEGELTREWREAHRGELEPASVLLERILEERRARWEAEQLEKEKMRAKGKVPKDDKWKRKYKEPSAADWGSLHELPDGWVWVTLEQIAKDTRIGIVRSLRQQNAEGRGAAYIKMNNVTMDGRVLLDDLVFVETSKDELRRYGIRKGDVLFNTRNSVELVGKTGLVRQDVKDTVYNNNLMRIRATGGVFPEFLVYQMCSNSYRRRLERVKRATTNVAALYAKDMLPLPMVLPPTTEQRAIADEVERRLSVIDDLERAVEQSLKRAERLRQSILKRAFEGKLAPQDPSDEPASVLLERIKAEKARREGERKGRKKGSRKKRRKTEKAQQLKML